MKKSTGTIQLIASLCLLLGSTVNLLRICLHLPTAVSLASLPFLFASIVLYGVYLRHLRR